MLDGSECLSQTTPALQQRLDAAAVILLDATIAPAVINYICGYCHGAGRAPESLWLLTDGTFDAALVFPAVLPHCYCCQTLAECKLWLDKILK